MAGNGEHRAALLIAIARCNQRSRPPGRLDDGDAINKTGDDSISTRKILPARFEAGWHFADQATTRADFTLQIRVLRWIGDIQATGNDGDCAGVQCSRMRGTIDATCKARDDDKSGLAELARKFACKCMPSRRTIA